MREPPERLGTRRMRPRSARRSPPSSRPCSRTSSPIESEPAEARRLLEVAAQRDPVSMAIADELTPEAMSAAVGRHDHGDGRMEAEIRTMPVMMVLDAVRREAARVTWAAERTAGSDLRAREEREREAATVRNPHAQVRRALALSARGRRCRPTGETSTRAVGVECGCSARGMARGVATEGHERARPTPPLPPGAALRRAGRLEAHGEADAGGPGPVVRAGARHVDRAAERNPIPVISAVQCEHRAGSACLRTQALA